MASSISRREFLSKMGKSVTVGISAGLLSTTFTPYSVLGANESVNMAMIGCGGRGKVVVRGLIEEGANISYVCDVHQDRLDGAVELITNVQGRKPKSTQDMRHIFDDTDVDAVLITTPDHWHALATIRACQAEKDVYVEKPNSHNIWESLQVIKAAKKYNRIVQVGTQNRSGNYNMAAREYINSGKLGDIHLVEVYNLKPGNSFYLGEQKSIPGGLDWDAWLGPAHKQQYYERIFSGGWHHFWNFSGGDLADDASHQLDLSLMLMGDPGMPKSISCSGGRLAHKGDDSEVPDVQMVSYQFDDYVLMLEHTDYPRYMQKTTNTIRRNDALPYWAQNATRIQIYGSDLLMYVGRHGGGWQVVTSGGEVVDQMYGRPPDRSHEANFLECVKTRKRPNASAETLHPAISMLHMANIAYRVGNQKLWFDAVNQNFMNNDQANKLFKRQYRKGYEIPENI